MLTRINADKYKKPLNTVQDKLTQDDINDLLEEYEQITELHELKVGMHVRYFNIIEHEGEERKLFRMGGNIIKIDLEKEYMVLANDKKISWSVQLSDKTIIYRKMTTDEIKQFYENELDSKESEIKMYKIQIENLRNEINKYKNDLVDIKKLLKKSKIIK